LEYLLIPVVKDCPTQGIQSGDLNREVFTAVVDLRTCRALRDLENSWQGLSKLALRGLGGWNLMDFPHWISQARDLDQAHVTKWMTHDVTIIKHLDTKKIPENSSIPIFPSNFPDLPRFLSSSPFDSPGWPQFLRLAVPNFLMISEWWAAEIIVLLAGTLPGAEVSLTAMAIFSNTCCLDALTWILRGLFIFNPPKK
jgi:hypothetical protein